MYIPDLAIQHAERGTRARNAAIDKIGAGGEADIRDWHAAMSADNVFALAAERGVDPAVMAIRGARSDHPGAQKFMAPFARVAEDQVVHPVPPMEIDDVLLAAGEDASGLGRLDRVKLRALERGHRRQDMTNTKAVVQAMTDWTICAERRGDTSRADRLASLTLAAGRNIPPTAREKTRRRGYEAEF